MRNTAESSNKIFKLIFQPILILIFTLLASQFLPRFLSVFHISISSDFGKILYYLLIVLAWLSATWIINGLIEVIIWDRIFFKRLHTPIPALIKDMVRIVIYFLMILAITSNVFGTSINGFLAASGVIGLIVGFAVKNLIADLFNGLALNFDQPFTAGELLSIPVLSNTGVLKVIDTTWRTTRLETESNDLLAIPNSKLATLVIVNLSRNQQGIFHLLVQVELDLSPQRAINILESAVKSAKGVLRNPEPKVFINALKNNAIVYKILYWLEPIKNLPFQAKHNINENIIKFFRLCGFSLNREVFTHNPIIEGQLDQPLPPAIFLNFIKLFSSLSQEERDKLSEKILVRHFTKGSTVVELGDQGDSLFIVAEGLLNVLIRPSAEMEFISVNFLSIGDYFGEMSLLAGEPRSARITCENNVTLYEVTKNAIADLLQQHPKLIEDFSRIIAEREAHNQEKQLEALSLSERKNQQETMMQKIAQKIKNFFSL